MTWLNHDGVAHHLVSDAPLFDTGSIAPNVSVNGKLTKAGTFTYHCVIYPTMVGTIVVNP